MAQDKTGQLPAAENSRPTQASAWRRWFGQGNGTEVGETGNNDTAGSTGGTEQDVPHDEDDEQRPGLIRRVSRKVVPGLPRAQTFRRRISEVRNNLEPFEPTRVERRAVSMDRKHHVPHHDAGSTSNPRSSAPDFTRNDTFNARASTPSAAGSVYEGKPFEDRAESPVREKQVERPADEPDEKTFDDAASMTASQYDNMIHDELERIWILNLSMHFRDKSKREKFFVTYREKESHWRRVTVSLDYRGAPDNSLEMDLLHTRFQRDKSAKIYEAIRESLVDIQFYDTVTNLKLQTTDGRLHVHVVEDVNEIIEYPTGRMVQHLGCRGVRESEIDFVAHMSGFVYKVKVNGETLIKKEIPGPDTVDEFLYEINALSRLNRSRNVIHFYGVVVDDRGEHVKGLLISYAEQGALIDMIYDYNHGLPWGRREKWARQIVEGLSEIHEAGFVQGDFTLSNIVIDHHDNAKIIDINRRGCPVGWEPPEATPLIESNQRISMYIGVKSDLYQLGMVLWALAEQEDEPEAQGRPLTFGEEQEVPQWYKAVVRTCLAESPQYRLAAAELLRRFPPRQEADIDFARGLQPSISVDDGVSVQEFLVDEHETSNGPIIKTVHMPSAWNYGHSLGHTYVETPTASSNEQYYYPTRGRSPPSPIPSNLDYCEPRWSHRGAPWDHSRDASFERRRSSSGSDLAPHALVPSNCDQGSTGVLRKQDDAPQTTPTREGSNGTMSVGKMASATLQGQPSDHGATTPGEKAHGAGTPRQASPSRLCSVDNRLPMENGEDSKSAADSSEHSSGAGLGGETEVDAPSGHDTQTYAGKQNHASQNSGSGVRDFFTLNNTTQNPLFQEAGITGPAAPGTVALVPRAAEVQKAKSASTVLDTRQGWEVERIDSAVEMNHSSASSPELWSGTRLQDDLLHLGSGQSNSDGVSVPGGGKKANIDEDLLTAC